MFVDRVPYNVVSPRLETLCNKINNSSSRRISFCVDAKLLVHYLLKKYTFSMETDDVTFNCCEKALL